MFQRTFDYASRNAFQKQMLFILFRNEKELINLFLYFLNLNYRYLLYLVLRNCRFYNDQWLNWKNFVFCWQGLKLQFWKRAFLMPSSSTHARYKTVQKRNFRKTVKQITLIENLYCISLDVVYIVSQRKTAAKKWLLDRNF